MLQKILSKETLCVSVEWKGNSQRLFIQKYARLDLRVEPMYAALDLRARRAQLEPDGTLHDAAPQLRNIPHSNILQRMLQARIEVL